MMMTMLMVTAGVRGHAGRGFGASVVYRAYSIGFGSEGVLSNKSLFSRGS